MVASPSLKFLFPRVTSASLGFSTVLISIEDRIPQSGTFDRGGVSHLGKVPVEYFLGRVGLYDRTIWIVQSISPIYSTPDLGSQPLYQCISVK